MTTKMTFRDFSYRTPEAFDDLNESMRSVRDETMSAFDAHIEKALEALQPGHGLAVSGFTMTNDRRVVAEIIQLEEFQHPPVGREWTVFRRK